jgi:hypothetical protein
MTSGPTWQRLKGGWAGAGPTAMLGQDAVGRAKSRGSANGLQ